MTHICDKCGRKMEGGVQGTCRVCILRQNQRMEDAMTLLRLMTPSERTEVFYKFCIHCGSDDPTCQCCNDE